MLSLLQNFSLYVNEGNDIDIVIRLCIRTYFNTPKHVMRIILYRLLSV